MEEKPATRKLEAILTLAKDDLGSRRKSPWRWIICGGLLVALVGSFFWWVGTPKPPPKPIVIMASDAIAKPEEPVALLGRIETADDPTDFHDIDHTKLIGQETVSNHQWSVDCNARGVAQFDTTFGSSQLPFTWFVRFPGTPRRPPVQAKGAVYVRPQETPWLIVDADHALPAISEQDFWRREGIDVPLVHGALAALREASARRQLVYVASSADTVSKHLRFQAWLARGWAPASEQPPPGPLFTRAATPVDVDASAFLQSIAGSLQKRFAPPVVALTARPEEARAFVEAGVRTLMVGDDGSAPPGVFVLKSWSDNLAEKIEGRGK
jgi:hypothetical protein